MTGPQRTAGPGIAKDTAPERHSFGTTISPVEDESATGPHLAIAVQSEAGKVELTIDGPDPSDRHTHPVRKASKKAAVRFALGEPGRRGTIWRLWAPPKTGDVYLASRMTAGEAKISLHQSGDWRFQMVDPQRPKTIHLPNPPAHGGRILHQWSRPSPNDVGWIRALTITLPGTHLPAIPWDMPDVDDVRWCPAPTEQQQAEFDVWIVKPNFGAVAFEIPPAGRLYVVDALALATGDVALVIGLVGPIKPEIADAERWSDAQSPAPIDWDRSPASSPRQMVTATPADGGAPTFYDLALPKHC